MALTIVGYQAVLFAVLSKVYAFHEGFLPASDRFNVFQRRLNLENLIGLGAVILLAGVLWMVVSLLWWQDAGFGELAAGGQRSRGGAGRARAGARWPDRDGRPVPLTAADPRRSTRSRTRLRGRRRSSRAFSRAGRPAAAAASVEAARTSRCPRTVTRRRADHRRARSSPASRQRASAAARGTRSPRRTGTSRRSASTSRVAGCRRYSSSGSVTANRRAALASARRW